MKKFLITVNQKQYEVEVEEIKASKAATTVKSAPNKINGGSKPAAAKSSKPKAAPANGHKVTAPMPGSVFKMLVSPGDEVKEGQPLLVFEAMKMENDLTSPADGKVSQVNVAEGDAIAVGDVLVVIE